MFNRYRSRMEYLGSSVNEVASRNSRDMMDYTFRNSTSYRQVYINDKCYDARVMTDSSSSARGGVGSYKIQFRQGVYFPAGTYIDIPDYNTKELCKWMIIYTSDDLLYQKPIIKKCNHLLRWKNRYGEIIERWCVFSDASKLGNGDRTAAKEKALLPYYTTSLLLPYDKETINIRRGKRFVIDDPNVDDNPDTYIVTSRNVTSKTFSSFDGNIDIAVSQHQFNPETDNRELMIADYYTDFDKPVNNPDTSRYTCNIKYISSPNLKMSTPYKEYSVEFYEDGELKEILPIWTINALDDVMKHIDYKTENNKLYVKANYSDELLGTHIIISVVDKYNNYRDELTVKVVSAI